MVRELPLTRLAHRLAQGGPSVQVVVTDSRGHPVKGARVQVRSSAETRDGDTDSQGTFTAFFGADLRSGQLIQIVAEQDGYVVQRTLPVSDLRYPVFLQIPVCIAGPFLTTPELIGAGAGVLLATAGFLWKKQPLVLAGEILAGASAFSAIFRHSCP